MPYLKIQISDDGCTHCSYNKETVVDHNYYGESNRVHMCCLFNQKIFNSEPCNNCIQARRQSDKEMDSLFEQINAMSIESYCNGIRDFENVVKQHVDKPEAIEKLARDLERKATT